MKRTVGKRGTVFMGGEFLDDHTVVGRALAVIEAVVACGPNATLADLARLTGIPKPTALRIANDLVHRRLLRRTPNGYALGPELSRLGETASLQRDFDRYLPVLEELHAAHGGVAWLTAGRELAKVQPVGMVCDDGLEGIARAGWPAPGSAAMLINTAGGHLALAHQSDLLERVARNGMAPSTPHSLREVSQLYASVGRARQEGFAVESEQSARGWTCAAALLPARADKRAVVGVTIPVGRANARELIRSVLRALEAIVADIAPPGK
ncbi:IclR family transcriptional regulator [Mycobacterium neglectum]|jgi:DNA-binding IclR family transcriptional regulator|uniref:IclR family transcriptional regulator n=1 Tax=Mycobacterium neglectum TaxID=242737 RepID=UPI000BFED350|nr:helix-turn-helix domain-containing protein [Mycobacterium neglectum]